MTEGREGEEATGKRDGATTVPLTPTEMETNILLRRFGDHVRKWYPKCEIPEHPDYRFHVKDEPFELWSGIFALRNETLQNSNSKDQTIWLLWNGAQTTSYADPCDAYYRLVEGQKARRTESKFKYFTSPLTVSAVLAVLLLILISVLELFSKEVPNQLWSVFTAIVAFYFGRESGSRETPGLGQWR